MNNYAKSAIEERVKDINLIINIGEEQNEELKKDINRLIDKEKKWKADLDKLKCEKEELEKELLKENR